MDLDRATKTSLDAVASCARLMSLQELAAAYRTASRSGNQTWIDATTYQWASRLASVAPKDAELAQQGASS